MRPRTGSRTGFGRTASRGGAQSGSAIVLALMMGVGMVVLTVSLFRLSSGSSQRLNGGADERRAALLAEGGLNDAYEAIRRGGTGGVGSMATPATLGGGLLWVDATDLGGNRTELVATGMYGRGRKALKAVVEYSGGAAALFQTTLNSKEQLTLNQGVLIDSYDSSLGDYASQATNVTNGLTHAGMNGDVRSNEGIVLNANATLLGDAIPGMGFGVSMASGSYVSGATTPAASAFTFPPITFPSFPAAGDKTVATGGSGSIASGNYEFGTISIGKSGTLTITGPATIVTTDFSGGKDASLVVDATNGPVEILVRGIYSHIAGFEASAANGSPMALAFKIDGTQDVIFPAATAIRGAYYAPNANIVFSNLNECWGAFAANRISMSNDMKFHFDEDLLNHFEDDTGQGDDGLDVLGWCEVAVEPARLLADRRDPARVLGVNRAGLPGPGAVLEGVP